MVVGYGYWGPNLVRNVAERPEFKLLGLCERDERPRRRLPPAHPGHLRCESTSTPPSPTPRSKPWRSPPRRTPTTRSSARPSRPASTCWSRSRWRAPPSEAAELIALAEELDLVLMPGHTFLYSPSVNKVRETDPRRGAGRDLLRHLLADEPRPLPAGRGRPRPRPARPLDPPALAGRAAGRGHRQRPQRLPGRRPRDRLPDPPLRGRRPRRTSRSPGWRRARCARWSSSAAAGWSSTRTPPPTTPVRIYDRGLDFAEPPANFGEYRLTYRTGDMVAPRIEAARAARSGAAGLRRGDPRGNHAGLQCRGWGWRSCSGWRRSSSRCNHGANRSRYAPSTRRSRPGAAAGSPPNRATADRLRRPARVPAERRLERLAFGEVDHHAREGASSLHRHPVALRLARHAPPRRQAPARPRSPCRGSRVGRRQEARRRQRRPPARSLAAN